jgi:transposase InsO family protein
MRYSLESRCRIVQLILAGSSPPAAAAACGASRATGYRLWRRYREGGWAALVDRPPVPRRQPRRLSRELEQRILAARAAARAGPLIVAGQLGLSASTVWKVLRRYGVSRLPRPARGPVVRYERERPGELLHVDIKRLGRFWTLGKRVLGSDVGNTSRHAGWQYLHLAIDDHSRLAFAELLPSERPADCVAFLHRAVAWYAEHGITIERVLSDNGNGYRSLAWRETCAELAIGRRHTRSRRPQTNGKAEALVKTLLREWAYRFAYPSSTHRARALPGYLRWYNHHRPHSSLRGQPPISRVSQVCGSHS